MTSSIDKVPGLKDILDKCQEDVSALIGWPASIHYSIQIHKITVERLKNIICEAAEMTWTKIVSDDSTRPIVVPRKVFVYYATFFLGMNEKQIAEVIGRDRSYIAKTPYEIAGYIQAGDRYVMDLIEKIEPKLYAK